MFQPSVPLRPRNPDGKLRALVIGRISTEHQKEESIEASFRYVKDHLARMDDGPIELECLGERASGMLADRATIRRAEELITSGRIDVIVAEDLSRIYRNPRLQYDFVHDNGCRVICIADNLDTGTDHWELALGAAAFRHGMFIPDVRRRVRRTATHAFHNGGMVLKVRYGYRRLSKEESATGHFGPRGLRVAKLPECTQTIRQMARWVQEGVSYIRIAERLNQAGVCPGPYARNECWSAINVVNLLRDPILSGTRRFRVIQYEPIYGTGKHRRRKAGAPETKVYPELAHLSVAEQEELWEAMSRRAASWQVRADQVSKRLNISRSKSLWPGQAATCGICGGNMYDLGRHLKCQNALPGAVHPCWNHVQVPIELTRLRVVVWVLEESAQHPRARDALLDCVWAELENASRGSRSELCLVERRIAELQTAAGNLAKAIAKGGELEVLVNELTTIQLELRELGGQKTRLAGAEHQDGFRQNREQVGLQLQDFLVERLTTSYEFADVFRQFVTAFRIIPAQALDTPQVRPRGRLTLDLARLIGGAENGQPLTPVTTDIDLFQPPEHIRWLEACIRLKGENPHQSLKQMARRLGINHMTVKRACDYARRMQTSGLSEPYRVLTEPPLRSSRWRKRRARES